MQRDLNIAPLLINHQSQPGKTSWVKIFIYEPAEAEVLQTRGTMYAVIALSAKNGVDFTPIMQLILEGLHTQYFQQTSGGILQTLEAALDDIHKKLILLGQEDKRLTDNFNFSLLTAVSWGTVLYFGQLGNSRAALYRNGKLFDIDEGEQKTTNLYLSSGVLQSQDRVILGTSQLFKRFNRTNLKQALSQPADKLVGALESQLDPGPARSEQSAIVLDVQINQVPSVKDEAIRIHDSASPIINRRAAQHAAKGLSSGIGRVVHGIRRIITWHIGKVPLLPIIVAIIAIIALVVSVSGGDVWQPPQFGPNQALISGATDKLKQATDVAAINPDRALDLLVQADRYLDQGLADYPQNEQLLALRKQYDKLLQQVLIVTTFQPIHLAKVDASPVQAKIIYAENMLYLIDSQKQELLAIAPNGKVSSKATNSRMGRGSLLAATDNGLVLVARGQATPIAFNGEIGSSGELPASAQATSLTGFNQNGYLLDRVGQLYRIPSEEDSVGRISQYFERPIGGEELVDVAVDGSIYLLHQDGSIDVYLNGERQQLSLERSNLANGAKAVFVSERSKHIFVMQDHALLVWTKDGKYQGQYRSSKDNKWEMAGLDFSSNTLYVLSNGELLKAKLEL